jgi:type I restriction enzyme S subunit
MDAKVGGYGFVPPELDGAIVSSHYYLFELDDSKLHPPFLEVISQSQIIQQQIVPKGSTNYSSIRPDSVLSWKIPLPDLDIQKRVSRNFEAIQTKLGSVENEITHQQTLLAKLKQAILQEAIQGKLTADWREANPDVETASQLLQRIQAEKARLIAEKKLRPEKPLPKITPAEIPFEIPKCWEWARFSSLGVVSPRNEVADDIEVSFVPMAAISTDLFSRIETEVRRWKEIKSGYTHIANGDVALAKITPCFENGKAAMFKGLINSVGAGTTELHVLRPIKVVAAYLLLFLKSPSFIQAGIPKMTGTAGQKRVPTEYFAHALIPLPPLAEQAAIVERVESLMTTCRVLEAEIEQSRTHAANLLQAVLKEAFAPASMD